MAKVEASILISLIELNIGRQDNRPSNGYQVTINPHGIVIYVTKSWLFQPFFGEKKLCHKSLFIDSITRHIHSLIEVDWSPILLIEIGGLIYVKVSIVYE